MRGYDWQDGWRATGIYKKIASTLDPSSNNAAANVPRKVDTLVKTEEE